MTRNARVNRLKAVQKFGLGMSMQKEDWAPIPVTLSYIGRFQGDCSIQFRIKRFWLLFPFLWGVKTNKDFSESVFHFRGKRNAGTTSSVNNFKMIKNLSSTGLSVEISKFLTELLFHMKLSIWKKLNIFNSYDKNELV